jgi:peptide/nickel transport system ATP-binding protein
MKTITNDQSPILIIEDLTVAYRYGDLLLDAVRDFSLQIAAGQTYGLVGESGSGKTTVAMAVMRYLGDTGVVRAGKIEFDGRDLLSLSTAEMRQVWGAEMSLVPQNPLSSLNPSIRVGEQLSEILRHHQGLDREAASARTLELFRMVRLPDPQRVADSYPYQISGGMQQRVLIAMALSTTWWRKSVIEWRSFTLVNWSKMQPWKIFLECRCTHILKDCWTASRVWEKRKTKFN